VDDVGQALFIMQTIQKAVILFKTLTPDQPEPAPRPPPPVEIKQLNEQEITAALAQSNAPVIPPSPSPDYDATVGAFDVVVCETYYSFLC
jgi:hypothetical protein